MVRFLFLLPILLAADDKADFARLSRDPDPDKRCRAVEIVAKQRDLAMAKLLLPLLADAHPRVRYRAMRALAAVDVREVTAFIVSQGLGHASPLARTTALEVLERLKTRPGAEVVLPRLKDPDPGVQAAACRMLGRLRDVLAVEPLVELVKSRGPGSVRAGAFEALAAVQPQAATELLAAVAKDADAEVRLAASAQAAVLEPDPATAAINGLIHDADWRVRSSALETARVLRRGSTLGEIISQYEQETGRMKAEFRDAMADLSGRDLGPEPAPWKTWWEANRGRFEPAPPGSLGMTQTEDGPGFFSIPIVSKRMLFILDLSGSMREPAPGDPGRTKLDVAKQGMIDTLRALPADARFTILGLGAEESGAYARKADVTFRRQLQLWPATPALRAEAEKFINGVQAKGWTNLWDAIEYAYGCRDIDTVYVYTDGGVSRGVWTAAAELLEQLALMNRRRRIVIHAVEVAGVKKNPADNVRLLEEIARLTKGKFQPADKK